MTEKCYTDQSFGKSHLASSKALCFTPEVTVYLCWQGCSVACSAPHWQHDTAQVPFTVLGRGSALLSSRRGCPGGRWAPRPPMAPGVDGGAARHFPVPERPLAPTARRGSAGSGPQHGRHPLGMASARWDGSECRTAPPAARLSCKVVRHLPTPVQEEPGVAINTPAFATGRSYFTSIFHEAV